MNDLSDSGSAKFNLPASGRAERRQDPFLEAVRELAGSEYEVYGEIGRGEDGAIVYLARDRVDKRLAVLQLASAAGDEYSLQVVKQLDASVLAPDSVCPSCRAPHREWARYCTMCGSDLWGDPSFGDDYTKEELLQAVTDAAQDRYEILGEMPRAEGGGYVYFGRDRATGKLSALRLLKEADDEYSLGRTSVLRRIASSAAARKLIRPSAPQRPKRPSPVPIPLGPPPPAPPQRDSVPLGPAPDAAPRPAYLGQRDQVLEFLRQPPVLAIVAVAVVVVFVSLWIAVRPGPDSTARLEPPPLESPPQTAAPVNLANEMPEEIVLRYSVAIASFRTLDEALARQRRLAELEVPVYVAPTDVRGSVYYRLLAAMLPRREEAEILMAQLVERGVKDSAGDWDVRPTGLAFRFGTYPDAREADAIVDRLARLGIPGYKVPAATSGPTVGYHVYAGGFEKPEEARHLEARIVEAGLEPELVERVGLAR